MRRSLHSRSRGQHQCFTLNNPHRVLYMICFTIRWNTSGGDIMKHRVISKRWYRRKPSTFSQALIPHLMAHLFECITQLFIVIPIVLQPDAHPNQVGTHDTSRRPTYPKNPIRHQQAPKANHKLPPTKPEQQPHIHQPMNQKLQ